jgi:hypothetical protein
VMALPTRSQDVKVIQAEGTSAVINAGSNFGFKEGGQVWVMRLRGGMWQEVSRARLTRVTPDMSRIEVVEGAPMVTFKPGDLIVKFNFGNKTKPALAAASDKAYQAENLNPALAFQKPVGVYVGPTVDMLMPQGDMRKCFNDEFGYGALVGFRFQNNFDISVRFMFASQNSEWSFWNLQLLGRIYDSTNLFADFGYGICYPSISDEAEKIVGKVQTIRMGFVAGAGYPFTLSSNKQFEIGFLYHYYPNFGKAAGQFLTIHGRFVIKS